VQKIGFVTSGVKTAPSGTEPPLSQKLLSRFQDRLGELGCHPGTHYELFDTYAAGSSTKLETDIDDVIRRDPDIIVTLDSRAMRVLKRKGLVGQGRPNIVAGHMRYPADGGTVEHVRGARESNVTGVLAPRGGIIPTQFIILKELLSDPRNQFPVEPGALRFGFAHYIGQTRDTEPARDMAEAGSAARLQGVTLVDIPIDNAPSGLTEAAYLKAELDQMAGKIDALVVTAYPIFSLNMKVIVDAAKTHHWPAIYPSSNFVTRGGLASYGSDRFEVMDRLGDLVAKLLKNPGARAGAYPLETLSRKFAINTDTAQDLGLYVLDDVAKYANTVYP
jgi:putative ABC transport system substrate-binding protein